MSTVTYYPISTPVEFSADDVIAVLNTTTSTSKDTGAIVVEGGVGIEENVNLGGNLGVGGYKTITGGYFYAHNAAVDGPLATSPANTLITLGTIVQNDTNLFTANTPTAGRTTVTTAGRYRIFATGSFEVTNNARAGIYFGIFINATLNSPSLVSAYSRSSNNVPYSSVSTEIIVDLAANDVIDIRGAVYTAANVQTYILGGVGSSKLIIERV